MNLHQSRSQLIRTSLSGNLKNQLTYNKLPVSYQKIQAYKQQLLIQAQNPFVSKRTIPLPSNSHKLLRQKAQSLTKFNETQASTFNRAKGISHRITSTSQKFRSTLRATFFKDQNTQKAQRASTSFKMHRNFQVQPRMQVYSPLEVIKTKNQSKNTSLIKNNQSSNHFSKRIRYCESALTRQSTPSLTQKPTRKFLRKGSSFDRSLIMNLLKSKLREKITSAPTNYANASSNALIYTAIKNQIPNEFRDIIGPEQMLRMSRILTGIGIKTVDMNDKIEAALATKVVKSKLKTHEQLVDDNQTLKSIKRW